MVRAPKYKKKKLSVLPAKYEKDFLSKLDARTQLYQTLVANRDEVLDDLGGKEALSHVQRGLVDRFVFLEALINKMEVDIATKSTNRLENIGKWIQAVNSLTGIAKTIGINRKKVASMWKDHGQTLEVEEVA